MEAQIVTRRGKATKKTRFEIPYWLLSLVEEVAKEEGVEEEKAIQYLITRGYELHKREPPLRPKQNP